MHDIEKQLIANANRMDSLGQKKEAVKLYEKAIRFNPKSVIALVNLATIFYELGDYKKSEKICLKALKINSSSPSALINLGNIAYQKKDLVTALDFYKKARAAKNNYYAAEINLANTYYDTKDYNRAITHADAASKLDETAVMPYVILGNSFLEIDKYQDSITALLKAKELDSFDAWIDNSLSQAYQKNLDWSNALDCAWSAVEKSRGADSQQINFGYLLYEYAMDNNIDSAHKFADKWLKNYPENQIAQHMANAIKNNKNVLRANDEYLKNIFDVFSDDFESVLSALDYQAPRLISGFISSFYAPDSKLKILDAGCGTGLLGQALQTKLDSRKIKLLGVDISEKMLDVAKAKKLYKKLFCDELEHFFQDKKKDYNLVVSADVFTYIGDLQKLFLSIKKSLKKNGRLIFSISENYLNDEGFFLDISGRFLHRKEYIFSTLEKAGFVVEKCERHKLRNEGEREVYGYIVSAV